MLRSLTSLSLFVDLLGSGNWVGVNGVEKKTKELIDSK
ncbi:hypothetical protein GLYMA_12G177675v4 [Glycine max]|nr:hypothetical protein GLYMA_12G177675v4 [Glycine max]KAH1143703.1 hypothetical protein GYH30_034101 [Glycine max]